MAHLNNRMAAYVEKVRSLEAENSTLKVQVEQYEEVSTSKTTKLKSIYEAELSEARRLLDETSKEKAQLALDKANYADKLNDATKENEELLSSNKKLQAELKSVHSSLQLKENFIATHENKLEATINDLREQHEVDMEQYKDDV